MAKAVFRNALLAPLLMVGALMIGLLISGIAAAPVAAQFFSAGYEFLKAVKDRDGTEATKILDETTGTVINARDKGTGAWGVPRQDLPPRPDSFAAALGTGYGLA